MTKHKDGQTAAVTKADEGPSALNAVPLRPVTPVAPKPSPDASTPRGHSKIAGLVALLGEGTGASLEDMTDATGWQPHTVRAALTGLRKRGFAIIRHVEGSTTVWSIGQAAQ